MAEQAERYKSKLIVEYQKFDHLDEMYNGLKSNHDKKISQLEGQMKSRMQSMEEHTKKRLEAADKELSQYEKVCFLRKM